MLLMLKFPPDFLLIRWLLTNVEMLHGKVRTVCLSIVLALNIVKWHLLQISPVITKIRDDVIIQRCKLICKKNCMRLIIVIARSLEIYQTEKSVLVVLTFAEEKERESILSSLEQKKSPINLLQATKTQPSLEPYRRRLSRQNLNSWKIVRGGLRGGAIVIGVENPKIHDTPVPINSCITYKCIIIHVRL